MIALSKDSEALARRLAEAKHLPVQDVIKQALEASARSAGVSREPFEPSRLAETTAARKASIARIVAQVKALPILDPRSPQEIMDELDEP